MNKIIISNSKHDEFQITVHNNGRFDFSVYKEFRDAYADHDRAYTYVLDLGAVEYIDSAALGMLLVLKEFADKHHSTLKIMNCKPYVKKIFQVANLDKYLLVG